MKRSTPGKLKINLSKSLVRDAVVKASKKACQDEIERQILLQIEGTRIQGQGISIEGETLFIKPNIYVGWPQISDSADLSFEWII